MSDEEFNVPGVGAEEPPAVAEPAEVPASGEALAVEDPPAAETSTEAPPGAEETPSTENVPEAQERVKRKFENVESPGPDAADGQQVVTDEQQGAGGFDAEAAKQKAADLAAKFALEGEAKRPRTDEPYDGNGAYGYPGTTEATASARVSGFSDGPTTYNEAPPGAGGENYSHVPDMSQQQSYYQTGGDGSTTKRMEVPNAKVGLVIGKAGETIKYLQQQSGARIQVTRDAEIDPSNPTRPVELVGTPEQIDRAEKLITEVISEAGTGGSGALVARGFGGPPPDAVSIKVPNNKVGLIIGRGGETIKNLQMRSGARIQVQSDRETDSTAPERTVTIIGNKRATDMAKDMILDVIDENRPRGPPNFGGGFGGGRGGGGGYGAPQQGYGGGYQAPYQAPPQQYGGSPGQYGEYQQPPPYGAPPPSYDYYGQQQQAPAAAAAPTAAGAADPSYAYSQQGQGYYGGYQQPAPAAAAGGYQQQGGYAQQAYGGGYGAQAAAPAYGGYGGGDQSYQQQGYAQQQYSGGYQQAAAEGGAAAGGGYDYAAGPTTTSSAPPSS